MDEVGTYLDETIQIERFLETVHAIRSIHEENKVYREKLFASNLESDEQRRIRRCITRRNNKIFDLLKEWRFESGVIDKIEKLVRENIEWFDLMNKTIVMCADSLGVSVTELRTNLTTKTKFVITSYSIHYTKLYDLKDIFSSGNLVFYRLQFRKKQGTFFL